MSSKVDKNVWFYKRGKELYVSNEPLSLGIKPSLKHISEQQFISKSRIYKYTTYYYIDGELDKMTKVSSYHGCWLAIENGIISMEIGVNMKKFNTKTRKIKPIEDYEAYHLRNLCNSPLSCNMFFHQYFRKYHKENVLPTTN